MENDKVHRFHVEFSDAEHDRLMRLVSKLSEVLGMKVTRSGAIKISLARACKKEGV